MRYFLREVVWYGGLAPAMQAGQCWRTVRMPLFCFSYRLLYIFMAFFAIIKRWIPAPVIFTLSFLSQECPFISLDEHAFLFYNKINIHSIIEEEMSMKFWIDGLDREMIRTMKNRLFLKRSWRFTHYGGGFFV